MDYYPSTSRPRSSYRGGNSYRGSSDSYTPYRGSRGSRGSSRGGYYPRGGRGTSSSTSSYYPSPKYESSPKYSSEASKYGSASREYSGGGDMSYHRRTESSYSTRDTDEISRKRVRSDSYSSSQALYSRRDDDSYRSPGRYSGGHSETRSYEDTRPFKKPRPTEYRSPKNDYRVKEPLRVRSVRGRLPARGIVSRRGRDTFGSRFRGTARPRVPVAASTSEILAIRRAKLLQNRQKAETAEKAAKDEEKDKNVSEIEDGAPAADIEKETGETSDKDSSVKADAERTTFYGKPFLKLVCPHCSLRCITFKEYIAHLYSPMHVKAIKQKSDELKATLADMRIEQREKQKVIDAEDLTSLTTRSFFCLICKLNCMQDKETHRATEMHKKLKKFLMPFCRICRIPFHSAMTYESHICSLDHLRRQHAEEQREKRIGTGVLDKFMILDSVEGGDEGDDKEDDPDEDKKPDEEPEVKEEDLTLGAEFIRTVKVKYCEVCRVYLPRVKDTDQAIKKHCRTKDHLRCYLHYGNEALLEKMQEDDQEENKTEVKLEVKEEPSEEALEGDELWGLGKLLDESQPNDDEDEEEGGRFDRFKTNEKKENGDVAASDEPEKEEKNGEVDAVEAVVEAST